MSLVNPIAIESIQLSDPQINSWFFSGFLTTVVFIPLCYLYAVFVCVPRYMEHRKPYSFKTYLICYNIFQVIANIFLIFLGMSIVIQDTGLYNMLFCCSTHYEPNQHAKDKAALFIYYNIILKLIDLSETVIFVLRNKTEQRSLLHVYHHISVVLIAWIGLRYHHTTQPVFPAVLNQSVHVLMYSYYLTTNLSPATRKYFGTFKRYLTILQMVQFILLIMHSSQPVVSSECDVPRKIGIIIMINMVIYLYLFYDFYQNSYIPRRTVKSD